MHIKLSEHLFPSKHSDISREELKTAVQISHKWYRVKTASASPCMEPRNSESDFKLFMHQQWKQ